MIAAPIRRRQLGARTGVEVTELGLGTAPLGETFDVIEEDEARALLAPPGTAACAISTPRPGTARARPSTGSAARSIAARARIMSFPAKIGRVLRRPLKPGPFQRGEWIGGLEFDA